MFKPALSFIKFPFCLLVLLSCYLRTVLFLCWILSYLSNVCIHRYRRLLLFCRHALDYLWISWFSRGALVDSCITYPGGADLDVNLLFVGYWFKQHSRFYFYLIAVELILIASLRSCCLTAHSRIYRQGMHKRDWQLSHRTLMTT